MPNLDLDNATNEDFFSMLFVLQINGLLHSLGIDKKYDWFKMSDEEKAKWRKFQENFVYPEDDPDWMEEE